MQLSFFGATQTVTGSRNRLTCGERQVLIDCGLLEGFKYFPRDLLIRAPATP
jgi:metallo-beta-lactamase family protein